jgi:hypothetical protein
MEQLSLNRYFCHLEDDLLGMARDLRPDLDHFLPQRRQGPVTHRSGQHRLTQEISQVVCQHEQLQPHLVAHEVVTGYAVVLLSVFNTCKYMGINQAV